ncbi:MAG: hypothetical protein F2752_04995, partial [Actinobacteria bacterium]|nr:hypothetical protein [Actinomycetota bacterium]
MSAKDPNQDFGANEWLVDEMYERYLTDPNSLEPSWIEFFKTYNPANKTFTTPTSNSSSSSSTSAPIAGAPRGGTPPTPKAAATPVTPASVATPAPVAKPAP